MIAKLEWTYRNAQQNRTITGLHNGSTNQQQQNHSLRRDSSQSQKKGLKCILLVPNLCSRFCCWWSTKTVQLAWKLQAAKTLVTSHKVRKVGKYQESIQGSTTPDPGYHMGKWQFCYLCFVFVMVSYLFIAALLPPAGKGLTFWLSFAMFHCVFITYMCGILGQV